MHGGGGVLKLSVSVLFFSALPSIYSKTKDVEAREKNSFFWGGAVAKMLETAGIIRTSDTGVLLNFYIANACQMSDGAAIFLQKKRNIIILKGMSLFSRSDYARVTHAFLSLHLCISDSRAFRFF